MGLRIHSENKWDKGCSRWRAGARRRPPAQLGVDRMEGEVWERTSYTLCAWPGAEFTIYIYIYEITITVCVYDVWGCAHGVYGM